MGHSRYSSHGRNRRHFTGHTLNIYSAIGIVLLVGLVAKNAILLVDFANQERARGTELLSALVAAGRRAFAPS